MRPDTSSSTAPPGGLSVGEYQHGTDRIAAFPAATPANRLLIGTF